MTKPRAVRRMIRRSVRIVPLAFPLLVSVSTRASAQATATSARPNVVVLGTGTPNADPDRSGPAIAIVANGHAYLVDAGPGIVRRAAAAERAGVGALAPKLLDRVFITHLHSDHTVGLPDLIFTPWVLERHVPLSVYGPPGIKAMTDHLEQAYVEDVRVRIDGAEPANETGYRVDAHEVDTGVVYRDTNVVVRAFAVPHGDWKVAYGYRFDARGRSIVISGDTHASDVRQAPAGVAALPRRGPYVDQGARRTREPCAPEASRAVPSAVLGYGRCGADPGDTRGRLQRARCVSQGSRRLLRRSSDSDG